jgi:hypothetical protein
MSRSAGIGSGKNVLLSELEKGPASERRTVEMRFDGIADAERAL